MSNKMWTDHLQGYEILKQIFGTTQVGESINLAKVVFEYSNIILHIDLSGWPENPPKNWVSSGYNTVRCELTLAGCNETALKHWAVVNSGELRVKQLNKASLLSVKFVSKAAAYISCICEAAIITKVSAYRSIPATPKS